MQFSQQMKWGWVRTVIARLLGLFLLVTTALKVHGLIVDPYGQDNFLTTGSLGLIVFGFTILTDDPWAALAKLRGETLTVSPANTQLCEGAAGEYRTFQIALRNYSNKAIKVVGGTTSCACIATQDLPITIPAGGSESIKVKIKYSGSPGKFAHRFVLYSDSDERLITARFSGAVVSPSFRGELSGSSEPNVVAIGTATATNRQPASPFEKPKLPAN